MSYTQATVIIKAQDQSAAQEDFPGSFVSGHYEMLPDVDTELVTHYVCSGLWSDEDLSRVVNDVMWPHRVYFGDAQVALDSVNLKAVTPQ